MTQATVNKIIAAVLVAASAVAGGSYVLPDDEKDILERVTRVEEKLDNVIQRVSEIRTDLRECKIP